jgi:hypothetical protein
MSLGEDRVRTKFNPSAKTTVDQLKSQTAALIDLCELGRLAAVDPEADRLWSLAQTYYETAAMYAVKAATS